MVDPANSADVNDSKGSVMVSRPMYPEISIIVLLLAVVGQPVRSNIHGWYCYLIMGK